MTNGTKNFATRKVNGRKRRKQKETEDSNQNDTRNRGLNRRGSIGLEGDKRADIEHSGYASTVVRQKGLQEIVSTLKLLYSLGRLEYHLLPSFCS